MFYELHTVPTRDGDGVVTRESRSFIISEDGILGVDRPWATDGPDCGSIITIPDGEVPIKVTETYDELKVALGVKYVGAPNFTPPSAV
jgi:hypothetical protein